MRASDCRINLPGGKVSEWHYDEHGRATHVRDYMPTTLTPEQIEHIETELAERAAAKSAGDTSA